MTNEQLNTIVETCKKEKRQFVKTVKECISKELNKPEILDINFTHFHTIPNKIFGTICGRAFDLEHIEDEDEFLRLKIISESKISGGIKALKVIQKNIKDKFTEQQLIVILRYLEEKNCFRAEIVNDEEKIKIFILKCFYKDTNTKIIKRAIPINWTAKELTEYVLATGDLPTKRQAKKLTK